MPASAPTRSLADTRARVTLVAGVIATLVLFWLLTGLNGGPGSVAVPAIAVLLLDGSWALLWLTSALGLGAVVRRILVPGLREPFMVDAALGVAALLVVDAVLARTGLLAAGGGIIAWGVLVPGWVLLIREAPGWRRDAAVMHPLAILAAPPAAVLLLAACSAPNWLWASEFGGYDALSYHLQLPLEWLRLGREQVLEHNVYSALPSYVEAAYHHLFALRGGDLRSALSCQLLHAGITLLTAGVTARLGRALAGPRLGAVAGVLVLATPWVIVVGSLAYNEMVVALLLGAGLVLLLADRIDDRPRLFVALGLLAGAACGAKLTAAGFATLPLGLLVLLIARRRLVAGTVMAGTAFVVLTPYLAGNLIETGNPVFPFFTGALGTAHWTTEQAALWSQGHASDLAFVDRLREGLLQLVRGDPNRGASIPLGQWWILPWLTAAAVTTLAVAHRRLDAVRLGLVLLVQIVFWLWLTHVKARFLLPAVVPAAALVTVALAELHRRITAAPARRGLGASLVVVLAVGVGGPVWLYATEREGAPAAAVDAIGVYTGEADEALLAVTNLTPDARRALAAGAVPGWWINYGLGDDARVLAIGEATPFYYEDRVTYQTTWDRGPMSRVMRDAPAASAAWLAALHDEGYTHLLISDTMLALWTREGWSDPLLTPGRVLDAAAAHATVVQRWPEAGLRLYELRRRPE